MTILHKSIHCLSDLSKTLRNMIVIYCFLVSLNFSVMMHRLNFDLMVFTFQHGSRLTANVLVTFIPT